MTTQSKQPTDAQTKRSNKRRNQLALTRVGSTKMLLSFLVMFILIDQLTRDYLFKISIDHIKLLREHYHSEALDLACLIFCEFGDKYGIAFVLVLACNILDLPKSFTMALVIPTSQAVISILKSVVHQPRPFFVSDIKPNLCRFEHGDPSGHAMGTVAVYSALLELIIREYQLCITSQRKIWFAAVIFFALMGFSRIYNGVHTYNQVISGYVWGYLIYYGFVHIFYYEICKFINTIEKVPKRKFFWNSITQGFLASYILQFFLFYFNSLIYPTPTQWIDGIQRNCKDVDMNNDPEMQNFEKFHLCFGWLGAYTALILEQLFLETKKYKHANQTSLATTSIRVILGSIAIAPSGMLTLISKQNPFWVVVIFRNLLPTFLGAFTLFGPMKLINLKLGLANTVTDVPIIVQNLQDSFQQDLDDSRQNSDEVK